MPKRNRAQLPSFYSSSQEACVAFKGAIIETSGDKHLQAMGFRGRLGVDCTSGPESLSRELPQF